jgi:cytochrome c556
MKFETFLAAAGMVAILGITGAGQTGQRGAPPQRGGAPAAPAPKPLLPVAANTVAAKPDAYAGEGVTISAEVVERVGATAFTIGQAGMTAPGQVVLVLAPRLNAPVEPNAYVTVIGEVVTFDPTEVAAKMKDSAPVLPPGAAEQYRGHAAIIASSVINAAMADLAKKPLPPVTADDRVLDPIMKRVGPAFNALRQAATASNATDAAAQATALSTAFTDATAFWKPKPHADANQWTADALHEATEIEAAAKKGDMEAVKASLPKLQQTCTACHNQYRERQDDGSYRIKQ